MRHELAAMRRRAIGLEQAGMYPLAERAFARWWAEAEAQGNWRSLADAAACATRLAVNRDRPSLALTLGASALPVILGRPRLDPDVLARLFVNLAKAAWWAGNFLELGAYADAARSTVEHESVAPSTRVHYGVVRALVALNAGDLTGAEAWLLQALDVAEAVGDPVASGLCRLNLAHMRIEQGEFDRARAAVGPLMVPGAQAPDPVSVLMNGVHIALGCQDVVQAGECARRAVAAYCAAPSLLSPVSVGWLFDALAHYHAAIGAARAAEVLGGTARDWFALRNWQREVQRLERWLAELPRIESGRIGHEPQVDPDALYLSDLYDAAYHAPDGPMAQSLATSVHHLLQRVEPPAPQAPCEHAALIRSLPQGRRWFTGRSPVGQAAERVLAEPEIPGRAGLDLLAAYEKLASAGASWGESLRAFYRAGLDRDGIAALDGLVREATA